MDVCVRLSELSRLHRPEPLGPAIDPSPGRTSWNVSQGPRSVPPAGTPPAKHSGAVTFHFLCGLDDPSFGASSCRPGKLILSIVDFSHRLLYSASSDGPRFSLTVFSATPLRALFAVSARRLLPSLQRRPLTGPVERASIVGQAQWTAPCALLLGPWSLVLGCWLLVTARPSRPPTQVKSRQASHQSKSQYQNPPTRALDLATPKAHANATPSPAPAFSNSG